jgi:hypothetical protein
MPSFTSNEQILQILRDAKEDYNPAQFLQIHGFTAKDFALVTREALQDFISHLTSRGFKIRPTDRHHSLISVLTEWIEREWAQEQPLQARQVQAREVRQYQAETRQVQYRQAQEARYQDRTRQAQYHHSETRQVQYQQAQTRQVQYPPATTSNSSWGSRPSLPRAPPLSPPGEYQDLYSYTTNSNLEDLDDNYSDNDNSYYSDDLD